MGSSQSFGRFAPRLSHLVAGAGGVAGEVGLLRRQVDEAFTALESTTAGDSTFVGEVIQVQAGDDDGIKLSIASVVAPTTYVSADFDGVLAVGTGAALITCPKRITVLIGGTGADWLGGNIDLIGTDVDGLPQTETMVSAANVGTTTSTKFFESLTSIALPACGDVGATVKIGVSAEVACIANGTSSASIQTLNLSTDFNRNRIGSRVLEQPRALSLILSNHADWDVGTLVVSGFDINGDAISESFAIPNNGNSTVNGAKFFAQVTSMVMSAMSGTAGTWTLGIRDTILGLPVPKLNGAIAAVGIRELTRADSATAWSVAVAGTVTDAASALPNGSYTPNTAPDGASGRILLYVRDPV